VRQIFALFLAIYTVTVCAADFPQAIEPRAFHFPADHGSHAGFQTEWWYVTGNVETSEGRAFGYQFTIFRRAVDGETAAQRGRTSAWAMSDFYVGHAAISDLAEKNFYSDEIYRRGAVGLAGATDSAAIVHPDDAIRVYLADWDFTKTAGGWALRARFDDCAMNLELLETTPPFLNGKPGEEGLSRKGTKAGQASYYYSQAGLRTRGTLTVRGKSHTIVRGQSWLDREWGSNQLSQDQAGWDWFATQLDDGSALMLYILRREDGSVEPASGGTYVSPDGTATHVALADVTLTRGRTWTSPFSNGRYTLGWTIGIERLKLKLNVDAAQDDQEIRTSRFSKIHYYEGAIRVTGSRGEKAVRGDGYLEITGAPGQTRGGGRGLGGTL
jgi:predicted secreted hydrolase